MKKIKLLGSKLIENINYPRIPDVCIFNNPNDVYDAKFEEGDLLDANSIKQITKNIKPQDVQEYVTSTEFEQKVSEIDSKIDNINNEIVDLKEFDQDMNDAVDSFNIALKNTQQSVSDLAVFFESKITNDGGGLQNYVTIAQIKDPDVTGYSCVYNYTYGTYDYVFKGNELCILLNELLNNFYCNKTLKLELSTQLPKRGYLPLSTNGVFDYIKTTMQPMVQTIEEVQGNCNELRNNFTELQSNVTTTQNDLTTLRTDLTGVQSDLSQALGKIGQHTSDIQSIQSNITKTNETVASVKTDVDDLKSNKDIFMQEFTYVLNKDESLQASTYAQYCQSAVEKDKASFIGITHAYLKFQNVKGGIVGYGQFFGDTSTPGILGKVSYVSAYVFDSINGREHLDFLIR